MFENKSRVDGLGYLCLALTVVIGAALIVHAIWPHPMLGTTLTTNTLRDGLTGIQTTYAYKGDGPSVLSTNDRTVFVHGTGTHGVITHVYASDIFVVYEDTVTFHRGDTVYVRITRASAGYSPLGGAWRRQ